jgi:hypothetical protein
VQLKQKTVYFSMELKLQKKKRKGRTKGACFEFCNYICVCVYIYIFFLFKVFITVIIILNQKVTVYPVTLACIARKLYFIS